MYSFSYLEPLCCAMSSSKCCFLTCIQISQEASQVIWYSHLFQNFPQFIVIHTVKGFGIVKKVEIDVFLELSFFFHVALGISNYLLTWGYTHEGITKIKTVLISITLTPSSCLQTFYKSSFLPLFPNPRKSLQFYHCKLVCVSEIV